MKSAETTSGSPDPSSGGVAATTTGPSAGTTATSVIRCEGCRHLITDRYYVRTAERNWHCFCLRCSHCSLQLDSHLSCFQRNGHFYCKDDYYKLFYPKCAGCHNCIRPEDFVMKVRLRRDSGQLNFQLTTSPSSSPLSSSPTHLNLITNNKITPLQELELSADNINIRHNNGHGYQGDPGNHHVKYSDQDNFLLFHITCFTCSTCNQRLQKGDIFGLYANQIYCRYHRNDHCARSFSGHPVEPIFGSHIPAAIHGALSPYVSIYGNSSLPGEGLLSGGGGPIGGSSPGGSHNGSCASGGPGAAPGLGGPGGPTLAAAAPVGTTTTAVVRKGRPRKRKASVLGTDGTSPQQSNCSIHDGNPNASLTSLNESMSCGADGVGLSSLHDPMGSSNGGGPTCHNGQSQRTKRMRTSFKHHQLRTMKSYFSVNQNPDAKDLKQLAQKTGLSKRVLQNARAKFRRNNNKLQDSQQGSVGGCGSGSDVPGGNGGGQGSTSSLMGLNPETPSTGIGSPGGSSTRPFSTPSPSLMSSSHEQTTSNLLSAGAGGLGSGLDQPSSNSNSLMDTSHHAAVRQTPPPSPPNSGGGGGGGSVTGSSSLSLHHHFHPHPHHPHPPHPHPHHPGGHPRAIPVVDSSTDSIIPVLTSFF